MRQLFISLMGLWVFFSIVIMGVIAYAPLGSVCGAYLALDDSSASTYQGHTTRIDPITYLRLAPAPEYNDPFVSPDRQFAAIPDGQAFPYEVALFVEATTTHADPFLLFKTDDIFAFSWAADSQHVLISQRLADNSNIEITSYNSRTGAIHYQKVYDIASPILQASDDNAYLYTFINSSNTNFDGWSLIHTTTGTYAEFIYEDLNRLLTFSEDDSVAIAHRDTSFIIFNPQTGAVYPQFADPIDGFFPVTVGRNIWFYRSQTNPAIYRASLADGTLERIADAPYPLRAVSDDEQWLIFHDAFPHDITLYHLPTDTRHELGQFITGDYALPLIEFSPNGACVAIVLFDPPILQDNAVIVYDIRRPNARFLGQHPVDRLDLDTPIWQTNQ